MKYSFLREPVAFQAEIFDDVDLRYNLDYVDNTGTRHEQKLSDISYVNSDVPNLIAASLSYLPCDTSNFNTDRFIGIVACEIPRIGTRSLNEVSSVIAVLARKLESELGFESQIHSLSDAVIVYDMQTDSTIEFRANIPPNSRQLNLSVILPTNHELDDVERYDDARLAADLWAFLNDFAANLTIDMDCHPPDLGRYVFEKSDPHQVLRIGVPQAQDFCRFGMALLSAQDTLHSLVPEASVPKQSTSLDYKKWDGQVKDIGDEVLASIAKRAVVLARGGEISDEIIRIAAESEITFNGL